MVDLLNSPIMSSLRERGIIFGNTNYDELVRAVSGFSFFRSLLP